MTLRQQLISDYMLKFLTPITLTLAAWAFNSFAQRLERVETAIQTIQLNVGTLDGRIAICAMRLDSHEKQGK
jgi:hypothetical protein